MLPRLRVPAAVIRSSHGLLSAGAAGEMAHLIPVLSTVVEIPAAGHNPMLEQPLALVAAVRALLARWPANA